MTGWVFVLLFGCGGAVKTVEEDGDLISKWTMVFVEQPLALPMCANNML